MSVLDCKNLNVRFDTESGSIQAVRDFSLSLKKGECVGIVGESGSGKSQTFMAMLGLLADNGRAEGSVKLEGEEIAECAAGSLEQNSRQSRGDDLPGPHEFAHAFLKGWRTNVRGLDPSSRFICGGGETARP